MTASADENTGVSAEAIKLPSAEMEHAAELLRSHGWIVTAPADCRYGCFCDLFSLNPGSEPDGCVIDQDRRSDCIYANGLERKEQCKYWKAWTPETLKAFWQNLE